MSHTILVRTENDNVVQQMAVGSAVLEILNAEEPLTTFSLIKKLRGKYGLTLQDAMKLIENGGSDNLKAYLKNKQETQGQHSPEVEMCYQLSRFMERQAKPKTILEQCKEVFRSLFC